MADDAKLTTIDTNDGSGAIEDLLIP